METADDQRTIFITGTSTGIGRACALRLDRLGFRILATVRNDADAESLCAEASERLIPLRMDVTDEASIKAAATQASTLVGERGLYGLLNNAGIGTMVPTECAPPKEIRRIFDVNVFGTIAVTQSLLPLLRQAHGRIVNVSSMTSRLVMPFHGPYSASKAALNAFTDALRLELKSHGVHVSTVFPGFVITPTFDVAHYRKARTVVASLKAARDIYGLEYRRAMGFVAGRARNGISAERAAQQMCQAFTDKHPRRRYYAGIDARMVILLEPLLSGMLRDWVVLRGLGLPASARKSGL